MPTDDRHVGMAGPRPWPMNEARSTELAIPWMIGHPYLGQFYDNARLGYHRHRQDCARRIEARKLSCSGHICK